MRDRRLAWTFVEPAREPFDHPDWLFELKYDGFRALAFVDAGGTKLFSRRALEYRRFEDLRSELSLEINADDAVLDGEIVKLDGDGRPIFIDLMRRKGPFAFVAFDVLVANGKDLRKLPLTQRKEILRLVIPKRSSVILFSHHIGSHGRDFFAAVCAQDLEGIVAKRKDGSYDPTKTQWLKINRCAPSGLHRLRCRSELRKRIRAGRHRRHHGSQASTVG